MAKTSKAKLQQVLTKRLRLEEPEFHLEKLSGGKLSGNIVSDTFEEMDDLERQREIWDALEAEFGDDASALVGTLLAYTKAEWNIPLSGFEAPKRKSRAK
jgi:acid stress-induced BolA-like protein IbaG/YrbA